MPSIGRRRKRWREHSRRSSATTSALVAVLWGAGGTFCAGADLKGVADGRGNRTVPPKTGDAYDPLAGDGPMGPSRMQLSKPVIAAVSGHAVAGGLELALWCDLRVAEEDAVFGVFCRRWGVPLIDGGTIRLPRLIGQSRALDMILTGRPVGAAEAFEMGLANRVVKKGEARAKAEELAREIARMPQVCLRATDHPYTNNLRFRWPTRWRTNSRMAQRLSRAANRAPAPRVSQRAKAAGGSFENI
jgi:enoyl-CoA hydratase